MFARKWGFDPHQVRRLREVKGWTLRELAGRVGCSAQALHSLEAGLTKPQVDTLGKLAAAFGMPIDDFFARGDSTDR